PTSAPRCRGPCCSRALEHPRSDAPSDRRPGLARERHRSPVTRARPGGYAAGARILSIGIAATGLLSFAYFSVASYVLDDADYKGVSLLWSILFVTVSVIYRPIEQLLSRTIATRRAHGLHGGHPLRPP